MLRSQRHGCNMIRTWKIAKTRLNEIRFDDNSSLDAVTRQLPDGWYSTFRTFNSCTRVIGLSAHLRRLPNADASLLRARLTQALQPFRGDERERLTRENIFEALLVKNGKILEGLTSNFFWIGQIGNLPYLATAQRGILLGVTRTMIIRAARGRGLEVRFSPLRLDQLSLAKEAFITSNSRGVVPVVQIDDAQVGQGMVGVWTKRLSLAYAAYVEERSESIV